MSSDPAAPVACPHCGTYHIATCPRIKAIEYHTNGTVKRIELHEPQPVVRGIDWQNFKIGSQNVAD